MILVMKRKQDLQNALVIITIKYIINYNDIMFNYDSIFIKL